MAVMGDNPQPAATSVAVPVPASQAQPKKARKNPQRRKTEQAKQLTEPVKQKDATPKVTADRPSARRAQTSPATSTRPVQATETPGPANLQSIKPQALALAPAATITGGILGCVASAALLAGVGLWHEYAGAESAILAARTAKLCLDNVADDVTTSLKAGTYSTDEALDVLRRTTLSYASTVPGGVAYVERVFREVGLVRQSRGTDVDKLLRSVHGELGRAARKGATPESMRLMVINQLSRLSTVAGASVRDIVDRNPSLKPYEDGAVKSLQGSPAPKVPTLNVNMTVKQRKSSG
ncbi:hypothetical protein LTR27_007056 [Elasticomyces elasticus]|nr:hypothetical protein LTR27_007056 [Elasticomyces elasticus]